MKLSIVLITRNQSVLLKRNLDNYKFAHDAKLDCELIVVDDNSNDDELYETMQIISDFHARTGIGVFMRLNERHYPGGARNKGILATKGEYIWCCDGDDLINWPKLPDILSAINDNPNRAIFMLDYLINHQDGKLELITFSDKMLKTWQCGVMCWHKIIKREFYQQFVEGTLSEDIDWWMKSCLFKELDDYVAPGISAYTYFEKSPGSVTETGASLTPEIKTRLSNALADIRAQSILLQRPQGLVDHIDFITRTFCENDNFQ